MRYLVLGFCVVAAACGDTPFKSSTAPSRTTLGAASTNSGVAFANAGVASTNASGGSALPFRGTLQATETVADGLNRLSGTGEATHLGRFTLVSVFTVIPPPVSTASGEATWTAADGDQIFTTVTGQAVVTFPIAAIAETHTIVSGTGRFTNASGAFVVQRSVNVLTLGDSSGTIAGTINLGH